MSEWKDILEDVKEEITTTIEKLELLTKPQVKEVCEAFRTYFKTEKNKPLKDRKFYKDNYGGTVILIQFPKKSCLESSYNICGEPKQNKNGEGWNWYGIKFPLMKNEAGRFPIGVMFIPIDPSKWWEPEESREMHIFRGNITIKYKWLKDTLNPRYESVFLKEARERFNDPDIKTIDDLKETSEYWSEVDNRHNYTFNATQWLMEVI